MRSDKCGESMLPFRQRNKPTPHKTVLQLIPDANNPIMIGPQNHVCENTGENAAFFTDVFLGI